MLNDEPTSILFNEREGEKSTLGIMATTQIMSDNVERPDKCQWIIKEQLYDMILSMEPPLKRETLFVGSLACHYDHICEIQIDM